jgi:hypothetical protein
MRYGNCLTGALFLFYAKRKNKPKMLFGFRPESFVPHFMVETKDVLFHYKVEKNILPWPLCYLIFQGSFQALGLEKGSVFMNQNKKLLWILSISLILGILLAIWIENL